MISRLVNSDRFVATQAVPRWLAPLALAAVLAGGTIYGLVVMTQAAKPVEAAGFLTPVEDGELQIAAYVPRNHPELAVSGIRATVIFPDGSQTRAVIAGAREGAAALPNRDLLGDAQLGTLVRMQFTGSPPVSPTRLLEGLPVKLRFEPARRH